MANSQPLIREMTNDKIPIILTGTIIPNAPNTVYADPHVRRQEYLNSIRYYSQFSDVTFLENSPYPIGDDEDFHDLRRTLIHKMPVSRAIDQGKGYQEFEMLDSWLKSSVNPPDRWIKITGRYIYNNFAEIYEDCCRNRKPRMIIDCCARSKKARTYLFCIDTDFYLNRIAGAYQNCCDDNGMWIEDVIFRRLKDASNNEFNLFSVDPDLSAVSGSTGTVFRSNPLRRQAKKVLRRINLLFDKRFLWYTR